MGASISEGPGASILAVEGYYHYYPENGGIHFLGHIGIYLSTTWRHISEDGNHEYLKCHKYNGN